MDLPNEQALNDTAEGTPTSSTPQFKTFDDGLVSTMEFEIPAPPSKSDAPSEADAKREGKPEVVKEKENVSDASSDDEKQGGRLDRDSRFAQVIKSNRDLKQQIADLTQQIAQRQTEKGDNNTPTAKTLFGMNADELLDLQATDPIKYAELMRKELLKEFEQKKAEEQIQRTYQDYAKANPDFEDMWDSGEIERYMKNNPGHNTISAHQALTFEKRIEAERKAAAEEAINQMKADLRTKGRNAVVGQGPSGQITQQTLSDDDLKNPKKYGGVSAVLARRAEQRRQNAM